MITKGKLLLNQSILLLVLCSSIFSDNLKAQILNKNIEFNLASNQELWRYLIWLQYYETSISTTFDWKNEKKLKIDGSTFWVNGQSIANNIQGISNIEADRGFEILESWIHYESNLTFSIKFGIVNYNVQFDHVDAADLFINPSQGIGPDL